MSTQSIGAFVRFGAGSIPLLSPLTIAAIGTAVAQPGTATLLWIPLSFACTAFIVKIISCASYCALLRRLRSGLVEVCCGCLFNAQKFEDYGINPEEDLRSLRPYLQYPAFIERYVLDTNRIFHVDCSRQGSSTFIGHVAHRAPLFGAHIFTSTKPSERVSPFARFVLRHELGHACMAGSNRSTFRCATYGAAVAVLWGYWQVLVFSPGLAAIFLVAYFLVTVVSVKTWAVHSQVLEEMIADTLAVAMTSPEDCPRLLRIVLEMRDPRLNEQENVTRQQYLRDQVELRARATLSEYMEASMGMLAPPVRNRLLGLPAIAWFYVCVLLLSFLLGVWSEPVLLGPALLKVGLVWMAANSMTSATKCQLERLYSGFREQALRRIFTGLHEALDRWKQVPSSLGGGDDMPAKNASEAQDQTTSSPTVVEVCSGIGRPMDGDPGTRQPSAVSASEEAPRGDGAGKSGDELLQEKR